MNILILGGTRFVGRHIVDAFVQGGHRVTVLTRGKSPAALPEGVEHLLGDRDEGAAGLGALAGRSWDACVDVSGYTPLQVGASTALLSGGVERYVFVSTASVYADQSRHPIRETDPLLPAHPEGTAEVTFETYGPMKVACERLVERAFGDAGTVLRPQLIAGPLDRSARYSYWVDRAARGGTVLAAGEDRDHVQVIDARDLARFAVRVVEDRTGGTFNVAGPRVTWRAFLELLGVQDVVWTTPERLEAVGASPHELPIHLPSDGPQGGVMDMDATRALAAGLTLTDPAATARDTRAWSRDAGLGYALTPEREAELLRAVAAL